MSAVAIGGLAYILGQATEQLGAAAGPRIGGILNATVGNVGEIIIAGILILNNELDVVKASITGSIVGNLLLVLGASLFVGGLKNGIQRYDAQATGMNAASLILATIGLIVPATFAAILNAGAETGEGSAGLLQPGGAVGRRGRGAAPDLRGPDLISTSRRPEATAPR